MSIHRYRNIIFRHFSLVSFTFLLLLTGASTIFVYFISPLRDPTFLKEPLDFQPANTGSLIWWLEVLLLEGVREEHWLWGAFILAGLLAINLILVLWQWCRAQCILAGDWYQEESKIALFIALTVLGIGIWLLLRYVFVSYLLAQWLID